MSCFAGLERLSTVKMWGRRGLVAGGKVRGITPGVVRRTRERLATLRGSRWWG